MNKRTFWVGMGLMALGLAQGGCQGPLCPRGDELAIAGQAREAVKDYASCREQEKKNSKRWKELNGKIRALTPGIVNPVLEKWTRQPPQSLPAYKQALTELEEIRSYDEDPAVTSQGVAQRIETYNAGQKKMEEGRQDSIRAALDAAAKQQWKTALTLMDDAINKDPSDARTKGLRLTIVTQRDEYYSNAISKLCNERNWSDAASLLARFAAEMPAPEANLLKTLGQVVEDKKREVIQAEAQGDIAQHAYYRAFTRLLDVKLEPEGQLMRTVRKQGREYYLDQAKKMKGDGDNCSAYLAAVKAMTLSRLKPQDFKLEQIEPDARAIFEMYRDCDRLVGDAIHTEICVAAFDSSTADAAASKDKDKESADKGWRFADALTTDLRQKLPYGLGLDDRHRVDYAKAELKLDQHDALQLMRVSWVVQGNISIEFDDKGGEDRNRTVVVLVKKTVPNPNYDAQMEVFRARYGKKESKWPMDKLPKDTITEELPQTVTYKAGTKRFVGRCDVSVSVYSDIDGRIAHRKEFRVPEKDRVVTEEYCFSDDIKVPLGTDIKIDPPKPLKMISELDFKVNLERIVREQVADWLLECFGDREGRFLAEAKSYPKQFGEKKAIEAAAKGYLYCLKAGAAKVDPAKFAELEKLALLELTEPTSGNQAAKP